MNLPEPTDKLDRLLSSFFKSEMKQPWPAAPATASVASEPSALVTSRSRDAGRTSRYTLAASVALLLGSCWVLSNGFQPGERTGPATGTGISGVLGGASASNPDALKELRQNNAEKGTPGTRPKVELP